MYFEDENKLDITNLFPIIIIFINAVTAIVVKRETNS